MALFHFLRFRLRMLRFALTVKPVMGGSPDDDQDDKSGDDDADDKAAAGGDDDQDDKSGDDASDEADDADDDKKAAATTTEPDWKKEARKHERRAKQAAKRASDLESKLKDREEADKSETEKAIEAARAEGQAEADKANQAQRRADRLELAVTRQATKGVKLEQEVDGETKEVVVKFADPEDALVHLERAIARDEIDGDDVFDENGNVQKDALQSALAELLEEKPHLAATTESNGDEPKAKKPKGGSDAGKGHGSGDKDLEEMSADEHFKRIQRTKAP